MNVYAESSAVLAWLLGQARAAEIHQLLAAAELVMASTLTQVETDRALIRGAVLKELTEDDVTSRRAQLHRNALLWITLPIDDDIMVGARQRFPAEPVRTLDALHLSSALAAREAVADVVVLSLDSVVRENARALGFDVVPA